jgi:hypothetical protein
VDGRRGKLQLRGSAAARASADDGRVTSAAFAGLLFASVVPVVSVLIVAFGVLVILVEYVRKRGGRAFPWRRRG